VAAAYTTFGLVSISLLHPRSCSSTDLTCSGCIDAGTLNPYQEAIAIIGETLEEFDDDKLIPAFGFGDVATKDRHVFSLSQPGEGDVCRGFAGVY